MPTLPIVGAYYRPPATTILKHLPVGTPLIIQAEPDNPHDANAIAIYIKGENIPENDPDLDMHLGGFGTNVATLRATEYIHLGYIPATAAAALRAQGFPIDHEVAVTFDLSPRGAPLVRSMKDTME